MKQACQRVHTSRNTFRGVAHLSFSLTARALPHLLWLRGLLFPFPASPLNQRVQQSSNNSPVYGPFCKCPALTSINQSESHMLFSLPGIHFAACWDPSHLPRLGSNTTFPVSFPKHHFLISPNSTIFSLFIYYQVPNFSSFVYWLLWR